MKTLESRYLRLLSVFPAAHRERYQSEMLDTLMAGAQERQRAPRLRETLDLLWNAVWLRLRGEGTPGARDPRWADATALFGPLAALSLAVLYSLIPIGRLGWEQRLGSRRLAAPAMWWPVEDYPAAELIAAVGWLAVALIALARWRRIAAILATTGTLAHAGLLMTKYSENPAILVRHWPLVVFAATIAASLAWSRGGRPAGPSAACTCRFSGSQRSPVRDRCGSTR